MSKTNIIIAGIGGVGGFFGGMLAKYFYNNDQVAINFLARGNHLKEIQEKGLKVIKPDGEFIAIPNKATDNPSELGIADYIIISTKSYDLESVLQQLKPCINENTVILPLLNGVDSRDRIQSVLPNNLVLDGCVYIVARLKQAGVVENAGNIQTLYFGRDHFINEKMQKLEMLFKQAGIEATLSENISKLIWEKFIFISPTATATSFFNQRIGEIISDEQKLATAAALIEEVIVLAKAKNIEVSEDASAKALNKLKSMPFEATSSMHSDYLNNKPVTELESLTAYVLNESEKLNIAAPVYKELYTGLKSRRSH